MTAVTKCVVYRFPFPFDVFGISPRDENGQVVHPTPTDTFPLQSHAVDAAARMFPNIPIEWEDE